MTEDTHQWSTAKVLMTSSDTAGLTWAPEEDRPRLAAYNKYDDMYWNDGTQYALRVLDGEEPIYIPNPRTIVDTTSHYLLKGLEIVAEQATTKKALDALMKRETFLSRFNQAKLAGVGRGDFVMHMTANPSKEAGRRISINSVHPGNVFPIWDEDEPGRMVGVHLARVFYTDDDEKKMRIRRLTYRVVDPNGKRNSPTSRRISSEETIFEIDPNWYGPKAKKVKEIRKLTLLPPEITSIPVYWFPNRHWDGEDYGSSELRGLEILAQTISQGATDVSASLALEGLGVYATDGGRPVDNSGAEVDWEVAPGKVMEVPQGSYFRRVEGVGSITPAVDNMTYLEKRMFTAAGLTDVALGDVDAQVAQSGIALAIKFQPTLAKIEARDNMGIDKLTQLFFDWKTWHGVFEREQLDGDIVPSIGDKLPTDRVARLNELNNMFDRTIIPAEYYRSEMEKLGYKFPPNIVTMLEDEAQAKIDNARAAMLATREPGSPNNGDETSSEDGNTLPEKGNKSNNAKKPNESAGTEA